MGYGYYGRDREFTNQVHDKIALEEIYAPLGWTEFPIDKKELEKIDMEKAIDYVMVDKNGNKINVQERFREYHYHFYKDATLRYRRDFNADAERHESEFYKITADYLVYGIINASKNQILNNTKKGSFVKYAIINIEVLMKKIKEGRIILDESIGKPVVEGNKMRAAVNMNNDHSSSFVAFDVKGLNDLFGREGIILAQKGFY